MSRDSVARQDAFAKKQDLPYPLLADEDGRIAGAYGVAGGLLRAGLPKRQTFLIGADGRIARHWQSVDPASHPAEVLAALQAFQRGGESVDGPRAS